MLQNLLISGQMFMQSLLKINYHLWPYRCFCWGQLLRGTSPQNLCGPRSLTKACHTMGCPTMCKSLPISCPCNHEPVVMSQPCLVWQGDIAEGSAHLNANLYCLNTASVLYCSACTCLAQDEQLASRPVQVHLCRDFWVSLLL